MPTADARTDADGDLQPMCSGGTNTTPEIRNRIPKAPFEAEMGKGIRFFTISDSVAAERAIWPPLY